MSSFQKVLILQMYLVAVQAMSILVDKEKFLERKNCSMSCPEIKLYVLGRLFVSIFDDSNYKVPDFGHCLMYTMENLDTKILLKIFIFDKITCVHKGLKTQKKCQRISIKYLSEFLPLLNL